MRVYFRHSGQSVINNSPSSVPGGLAPITVFIGCQPFNPLDFVFLPDVSTFQSVSPSMESIRSGVDRLAEYLASVERRVMSVPSRSQPVRPGTRFEDFFCR